MNTELLEASVSDASLYPAGRTRRTLIKRLTDIVCLPSSRINGFERAMTADLLAEMLMDSPLPDRIRAAQRLATLPDIPEVLSAFLLADDLEVSSILLTSASNLSDSELISCVSRGVFDHRRLVAQRKGLGFAVTDALVSSGEPAILALLIQNDTARLSLAAIDALVDYSRDQPACVSELLRRPEIRPSHAYKMFWWADQAARKTILGRFAVSREVLHEVAGDLFPMAARETADNQQPIEGVTRRALQFIERRQRDRKAMAESPYGGLDQAIEVAEAQGFDRELLEAVSIMCGVRPSTGARILTDPGGEGIAIICKATGLPRRNVERIWKAMRRPALHSDGSPSHDLERVLMQYDMIPVDRAQTVLRYWNWSLGSKPGRLR